MIPKEIDILQEFLAGEPRAESIRFALSRKAISAEVALDMLRNIIREKGWNPDNLPRIGLPFDLPPSEHIVGAAASGDVLGEDVGLSEGDLTSHIAAFGMTSVGKTTLVKLILVAFTKGKLNG